MQKQDPRKNDKRYSPPAVEQASRILFALSKSTSPQLSLTEIHQQVGISASKAFGILTALEKSMLIRRGRDGRGYCLGPGILTLSRKVLDDISPSRLAEPVLEKLTKETGNTSVFGLITGETVHIVANRESEGEIRIVMRVGLIMPLTYGAHGKAIVAFLPKEERNRLLRKKKVYFHITPEKLDRTLLQEELDQCRRKGFACASAKSSSGITVIAAPVFGFTDIPIGFIEIFVPAPEKEAYQFGPILAKAGKALSRQFGANIERGNHEKIHPTIRS